MGFYEFRVSVAEFLGTEIINSSFIFFNLWHIVHFVSGAIVMILIIKVFKETSVKEKFILLLLFLSLYEVFEFGFIISGSDLFLGESFLDVLWDIVVGMLGGTLSFRFRKLFFH